MATAHKKMCLIVSSVTFTLAILTRSSTAGRGCESACCSDMLKDDREIVFKSTALCMRAFAKFVHAIPVSGSSFVKCYMHANK